MADTVTLSAALSSADASFAADTAIDSAVYALDDGDFAAIARHPSGVYLFGRFADPDVASFALVNRNAMKADDLVGVDDTVDKLFDKWLADNPVPS